MSESETLAALVDGPISAVPGGWEFNEQVADCFDDRERALLAYTDYLLDQHGRVPDAVFDALHEHFTDEEILEFTYITSLYFMHAVMTRALRLEFDDRNDPITEVPAPAGFDAEAFARE